MHIAFELARKRIPIIVVSFRPFSFVISSIGSIVGLCGKINSVPSAQNFRFRIN